MNVFSLALPKTSDQSVVVLDQITGVVQYFITGDSHEIVQSTFTKMLQHFNEAMLGFGLIIFAILLFVGTLNTAADGQFLGRNWNSVWTPIRIIFGVLFVVPLKTGLCFGQYIFLYVILIGVNIGTYVWNQVVTDVFQNYSPPAVPSYVTNYAQQAVENQLILASIDQIRQSVFPTSGSSSIASVTVNINNSYTAGNNVPASVIGLIGQQTASICGSLYADPAIQKACQAAINTVLQPGGNAQNGQMQTSIAPASLAAGGITVWLGGNEPAQTTVFPPVGGGTYAGPNFVPNAWAKPDGQVQVTGSYTYTFASQTNPEIDPNTNPNSTIAMRDASSGLRKDLQTQIASLVTNKIMVVQPAQSGNGYQNLCTEDDNSDDTSASSSCSLAAIANLVVANAQKAIENAPAPSGTVQCSPDSPGVKINPDLQDYPACGMSYLNADNQIVTPTIQIPLKGSWWNAGESYLILDDHFSQNLKVLIDAIQQNMLDLIGKQSVTGTLTAKTNIMVSEASGEYQEAFAQGPESSLGNYCFTDLTGLSGLANLCGLGSMMLYYSPPQAPFSATTTTIDMADLGTTGDWGAAILPYNPDLTEDYGLPPTPRDDQIAAAKALYAEKVPGTTEQFYNNLLNLPVTFQAPVELLLVLAQDTMSQDQANNTRSCPQANNTDNCYTTIYPYLSNLINVLEANGLLSNTGDVLPLNQAMNSMFTQLLGAQDANDPRVHAISSVMQDVYSFGDQKEGDIISQQFSLIQQVRNTGIGMIVACLGSISAVYDHYVEEVNGMLSNISNTLNGSEAQAAWGLGYAAAGSYTAAALAATVPYYGTKMATVLGFLGQAASTTSQILQTQVELAVTTTTITTMTNIAIQMLWLPLFIFVMVSLFTAGMQFALVIPFMPYIMFWAGQIAWVIGVLEALIAAPLVMLAFAHPGGNEYVGHAAPAVRFLIGVIFRPVLMVIGMVTGILLTYVLIHYSAQGFHVIAGSIFNAVPANNIMLSGTMSCLLLFTYASFMVMAFTKCFSPIYVIPEKVVQWINGHAERAGEQEAQQFGSNVQQTAQSGAQAGGQSLQQGAQAQQQRGQQMSDLEQKQYSQGIMMTTSSKMSEAGKEAAGTSIEFNNAKKG